MILKNVIYYYCCISHFILLLFFIMSKSYKSKAVLLKELKKNNPNLIICQFGINDKSFNGSIDGFNISKNGIIKLKNETKNK